jgi:curved DNA-binding protein CbpA
METLYDLLGALPDDGAENLRAAFRKAVKGAHPDIHPNDPDAALKFRRILRANEILSDEELRTGYDQLLDRARLERDAASEHASAAEIYRFATGVMVLVALSIVILGGYLLFGYVNTPPLGQAQATELSRAEPVKTAALVTEPTDRVGRTRDELDIDGAKTPETPKEINELNALDALESIAGGYSTSGTRSIYPAHDLEPKDAIYYREQATSAYRNGDLYFALVYFNLATSRDPGSSESYIDRAIVFHRQGDLKRAFADVAQAKIDGSNRDNTHHTRVP